MPILFHALAAPYFKREKNYDILISLELLPNIVTSQIRTEDDGRKQMKKKKLIRLTFRLQNYRLLSEFLQQKTVNSKRLVMYNKMRNQGKQKIIYQKRNLSRKIGVS